MGKTFKSYKTGTLEEMYPVLLPQWYSVKNNVSHPL